MSCNSVESFYSVDFNATGAGLDINPSVADAQRIATLEMQRLMRMTEISDAVLAKMCMIGTHVQVRYEALAAGGNIANRWWAGRVCEHRRMKRTEDGEEEEVEIEQIEVEFFVDEISKKRGIDEMVIEWVDFDTDVGLLD